ncbi:hypothetical protein ABIB27_000397 [Arthrobacter sp. UYEF21]
MVKKAGGPDLGALEEDVLVGIGLRMGENGNSYIYSALLVSFISMPAGAPCCPSSSAPSTASPAWH